MTNPEITVTIENPHDVLCISLLEELTAELSTLYNEDGSFGFTPADVTVPRSAFVVAWLDDEAVGCGALRPLADDTIGEIKRMYVRPAARGRGVSRQILIVLEALGRKFSYRELWLETGIRQPEAIGLYESAGYVQMRCYGPYASDPVSVCYHKTL
ncbi:MAG: GNAT family N-acetyltransferase [Chitinophagaceae bacterium]|nr:GNAT family N-acetyltransferase [Anaerolineae bacterium]